MSLLGLAHKREAPQLPRSPFGNSATLWTHSPSLHKDERVRGEKPHREVWTSRVWPQTCKEDIGDHIAQPTSQLTKARWMNTAGITWSREEPSQLSPAQPPTQRIISKYTAVAVKPPSFGLGCYASTQTPCGTLPNLIVCISPCQKVSTITLMHPLRMWLYVFVSFKNI